MSLKSLLNIGILLILFYVVFYAGAYTEWKHGEDIIKPEYNEVNKSYNYSMVWYRGTQNNEPDRGYSEMDFVDYKDNGTEKRLFANETNVIIPINCESRRSEFVHVGESVDGKNMWVVYTPSK